MDLPKKSAEDDSILRMADHNSLLLSTQWSPTANSVYSTNGGDASPLRGIYYSNLKSPDAGSLFSKRFAFRKYIVNIKKY